MMTPPILLFLMHWLELLGVEDVISSGSSDTVLENMQGKGMLSITRPGK